MSGGMGFTTNRAARTIPRMAAENKRTTVKERCLFIIVLPFRPAKAWPSSSFLLCKSSPKTT